jgi:drug/metabolite transporter (DMT)-like permease
MMTGWTFIILCAASSVLIAHFFKVTESRKLSTVNVLTVNYLIATFTAFALAFRHGVPDVITGDLGPSVILAIFVGIVFIANFFIYSKSVFHNGVGISVAAMRISLLIPVLVSTLWYLELLTVGQWTGVALVFVTLFLLLPNKRKMLREPFSAAWLLPLLFIGTGIGDASLKVYEVEFSTVLSKELFMGFVFLTALIVGVAVILIRKNRMINKDEWLLGMAIGVPNLLTAIFLIAALERMNGAVVYSAVNVLTVVGATLLGVIRWKDRFTKIQWIGIFLTLLSILLLI